MKKSTIHSLEASSAERVCSYELQEQEKRKANVVIFGINENVDAAETFSSLLSTCSVAPPINPPIISRLGAAKENKARLVRVQFSCSDDANSLLGNLSALRGNTEFKHISVRYDLTQHQTDIRRELTTIAKQRSTDSKVFYVVGRPNEWRIVESHKRPAA